MKLPEYAIDLQGSSTGSTPILKTPWCNVFGGENSGPDAVKYLGGLSRWHPTESKHARYWYCPTPAIGKFRLTCEHGHPGKITYLCEHHWRYWSKIKFCPRCHEPGHELHPQQQCELKWVAVS